MNSKEGSLLGKRGHENLQRILIFIEIQTFIFTLSRGTEAAFFFNVPFEH